MAKVFLVGGTPRVGKTSLTMAFIKERPVLATSADAIRYTLRRVIDRNKEPDLFNLGKFTSNDPEKRQYLIKHLDEIVIQQNKESAVVWRSVVNFINSNLEDGFDVLIEGTAVIPEFVRQLQCEYSVVFLGNQSHQHFETILHSARNNPNDWMHDLEDETIKAFWLFSQAFSKFLQEEANKHDLAYVEVSDSAFDDSMKQALQLLL